MDFTVRASGLTAWWLLLAEVTLGGIVAGTLGRHLVAPKRRLRWHRHLTLLLVAAVTTHILLLAGMSWRGWPWAAYLLPTPPLARAFGVVAMWLLAIVIPAAYLMRQMPLHWWRRFHRAIYLVAAVVTVHGLLAGPDRYLVALPGVFALGLVKAVAMARWHKRIARRIQQSRRIRQNLKALMEGSHLK